MVYCNYDMLNMFRALLCPSSGAIDYKCVLVAYGVQCLGADLSGFRCRAAGCASMKRNAAASLGGWLSGVRCRTAGCASMKRNAAASLGCWLSGVRCRTAGCASTTMDAAASLGCWLSGAEQQDVRSGSGRLQHPSSLTHTLLTLI